MHDLRVRRFDVFAVLFRVAVVAEFFKLLLFQLTQTFRRGEIVVIFLPHRVVVVILLIICATLDIITIFFQLLLRLLLLLFLLLVFKRGGERFRSNRTSRHPLLRRFQLANDFHRLCDVSRFTQQTDDARITLTIKNDIFLLRSRPAL